jgi:hypothetical protein
LFSLLCQCALHTERSAQSSGFESRVLVSVNASTREEVNRMTRKLHNKEPRISLPCAKYYKSYQIKEDEMGRARITHETQEIHTKFWWINLEGRHF